MPQEHRLKVLIDFFPALASGEKSFELRFDDRGYRVGDTLRLMEWTGVRFTGREAIREITYILAGKPWLENYVAMSLRAVQQPDTHPNPAEQQGTPTPRTDAAQKEYEDALALHGYDIKAVWLRFRETERELSAKTDEAERLREAYELKVADFAAETLRASGFQTLLSEVAASLCDTHGDMPRSKECRYCKLLTRVRAALAATRKEEGNG